MWLDLVLIFPYSHVKDSKLFQELWVQVSAKKLIARATKISLYIAIPFETALINTYN